MSKMREIGKETSAAVTAATAAAARANHPAMSPGAATWTADGGAGAGALGAGAAQSRPQVVVHIDLDCFFASAGLLNRPELAGKPVAVSHSKSQSGSGTVSACNYVSRAFGVKNGMKVSDAAKPVTRGNGTRAMHF